jgi:transcriptional regulator with XRE-family HTH domain
MSHPLKNWRDNEKLSQPDAGVKLGVDAMTISRWERGEHLPHKRHWATIEEKTGIAPSELIGHVKTGEAAQ